MPGLLASPTPAPTSATSAARPSSTATSGSSTARRSGRRPATSPTGSSCSPAPTRRAPKHKGITFLLVPDGPARRRGAADQDDHGEREFNEVFFTDARTPKENVVGEVNGGWAVAMTLLGYERGEAAATLPIMFRTELDRLLALAKRARQGRRPGHPPAPGVVLHQGRDHALPRHAHADPVPRRRAPRARGVDLQAVLERVPPARHRAGDRHPRADGAGARPAARRRPPSRPTTPARPTTRRRGSARSSTPGPARSTPAPARSSATSSARWCSACPRSRRPTRARGTSRRAADRSRMGPRRRRRWSSRPSLWPTAVAPGRRPGATGWWRRPPFLPRARPRVPPVPACRPSTAIPTHEPEPDDVVTYLQWCRSYRALPAVAFRRQCPYHQQHRGAGAR